MPSLISAEIQQLQDAPVLGRDVPVANQSGAKYALADGRKWVWKRKLAIGAHGMLAEALGWLWSRALALPVPDVAVYLPGEFTEDCWLSEVVDDVRHWSADRVPVENLEQLGGILALDVILMNADRHEGNILLQPRIEQEREVWRLWGIDMGNSKVGVVDEFLEMENSLPSIAKLPDDLPFEILRDPALEAAKEIAAWGGPFITKSVNEACSVAGSQDSTVLVDALKKRSAAGVALVERYFDKLLETT